MSHPKKKPTKPVKPAKAPDIVHRPGRRKAPPVEVPVPLAVPEVVEPTPAEVERREHVQANREALERARSKERGPRRGVDGADPAEG